jgi:osmotically inducible lipoprotein OsmB
MPSPTKTAFLLVPLALAATLSLAACGTDTTQRAATGAVAGAGGGGPVGAAAGAAVGTAVSKSKGE